MKTKCFSLTGNILYFFMLFTCVGIAIAQGVEPLFRANHQTKVLLILCVFLTYFTFLFYLKMTHQCKEDVYIFAIISFGVLLRCSYVLLSGLYDRQHDAGVFTGMGTNFVNPGHIGYIEYIYKFHKLPEVNPYELFGYYHPPLHHIISCVWLQLNIALGVIEELAFENLQIMTLLYSCLCMTVTYRILKLLATKGTGLYLGLAFVALHPSLIIMSGSVNNDMLTMLFMCLTILYTLKWIQDKTFPNLILLGLFLAFGMITKLNSAILALPIALIFLLHFIGICRLKVSSDIKLWIKNYFVFGIVTGTIGLSWIVRNLVTYHENPGVPVPGETSPMYTNIYTLWQRLGIPSLSDWRIFFPFHPISAEACHNTWVIMLQTSLFAEEFPTDATSFVLSLSQITYVLAIVLAIATATLFVFVMYKKIAGKEESLFLLTGYIVMLISFATFVIIYPYTCSSDFRYITICLVYIAIGIALGNRIFIDQPIATNAKIKKFGMIVMHLINYGIIVILACTTIIFSIWNRW